MAVSTCETAGPQDADVRSAGSAALAGSPWRLSILIVSWRAVDVGEQAARESGADHAASRVRGLAPARASMVWPDGRPGGSWFWAICAQAVRPGPQRADRPEPGPPGASVGPDHAGAGGRQTPDARRGVVRAGFPRRLFADVHGAPGDDQDRQPPGRPCKSRRSRRPDVSVLRTGGLTGADRHAGGGQRPLGPARGHSPLA